MLDQELLAKGALTEGQQQPPPPHLTNPYSQFQQYQQSMAGYNNMGYGFPMYTQNGYGYPLTGYPHAPSPPTDGKLPCVLSHASLSLVKPLSLALLFPRPSLPLIPGPS